MLRSMYGSTLLAQDPRPDPFQECAVAHQRFLLLDLVQGSCRHSLLSAGQAALHQVLAAKNGSTILHSLLSPRCEQASLKRCTTNISTQAKQHRSIAGGCAQNCPAKKLDMAQTRMALCAGSLRSGLGRRRQGGVVADAAPAAPRLEPALQVPLGHVVRIGHQRDGALAPDRPSLLFAVRAQEGLGPRLWRLLCRLSPPAAWTTLLEAELRGIASLGYA